MKLRLQHAGPAFNCPDCKIRVQEETDRYANEETTPEGRQSSIRFCATCGKERLKEEGSGNERAPEFQAANELLKGAPPIRVDGARTSPPEGSTSPTGDGEAGEGIDESVVTILPGEQQLIALRPYVYLTLRNQFSQTELRVGDFGKKGESVDALTRRIREVARTNFIEELALRAGSSV